MALALLISAGLGALLYVVVFRPLRNAPPLARAVASLGVLVVLQTLMSNRIGTSPVSVTAIDPSNRWTWQGVTLLSDRFYLALTVVFLTLVITALYRWTRFGLFTRATAESQMGAFVSGISPDRIALLNWIISGAVAGVAGILIAPLAPVTPDSYTLFVVPALAAAIVGGFQYIDEMSMGLAPTVVEALFERVKRIATDHGCAVLLVEQHVSLALEVAQSASVLNAARSCCGARPRSCSPMPSCSRPPTSAPCSPRPADRHLVVPMLAGRRRESLPGAGRSVLRRRGPRLRADSVGVRRFVADYRRLLDTVTRRTWTT